MDKTDELLNFLRTKNQFTANEVALKLCSALADMKACTQPRVKTVQTIKRYDVLFLNTIGMNHYVLVHKVVDQSVYGIVLSSQQQSHTLMPLVDDRYFNGNFATKTYLSYDLEHCKKRYARVYEAKKEANKVFSSIKDFYKTTLKI